MTLREWVQKTGVLPTHPTTETGAVSLCAEPDVPGYRDLWTLDDYRVSSVSGPVVWLVRRFRCSVCGWELGWDKPSGVCSEACLRAGQGFTTNEG